ncbi:MAG: class I SAM-dependent methyltransferase [Candidatus Thorarchaeota archaeon]
MEKKEIVRKGYNKVAEKISDGYKQVLKDESHIVNLLTDFIAKIPKDGRVLDVGCGNGVYSRYLSDRFNVIGIDISEKQIELAKQNVPKAEFRCEDMTKIDFPYEFFDGIIAFYSIIHVPRDEHFDLLRNFYRILKFNGIALLVFGINDDLESYEQNFFNKGVKMYWSSFDKNTNLNMVKKVGFNIIWANSVKESEKWGDNSHLFVFVEK